MSDEKTPRTDPSPSDGEPPKDSHALEGEPGIPSVSERPKVSVSRRGALAVVFAVVSLTAVSAVSIHRAFWGSKTEDSSKQLGDRPMAAAAELRRLDMTPPTAAVAPASAASVAGRLIPAILPLPEDPRVEPIPLRRAEPPHIAPEDAPVVLLASGSNGAGRLAAVAPRLATGTPSAEPAAEATDPLDATRRNLDAYQHQLQGMLDTLTRSTNAASKQAASSIAAAPVPQPNPPPAPQAAGSLFGGQLPFSTTPRVVAGMIGSRSLTLPKGTAFTCALKTRLVSAASGFVSCQVQRNVYSEDGRVLLIERGSHMDGEYRSTSVRPGTVRIPVLWTRIRTPNAVTVDIDSPGTGALGESGVDGYVDNRWIERIGAALLLSLIDDSIRLIESDQSGNAPGSTVVLPSTTTSASKLAEKVLDSTINIPPLIYQNQGAIVGIYVARDVDFSSVYELKAVER
jgi:type IV secretion system protein VirB10